MNIKFVNQYLSNIKWNLDNSQWQVSGIIDRISNEYLKFDIRFLNDFNDKKGKLINSKSKADKVLFEDDINWIFDFIYNTGDISDTYYKMVESTIFEEN